MFSFDDAVRDALLRDVIGQTSAGLSPSEEWEDAPKRCRNRLYDTFPSAHREIKVLFLAHQDGVLDDLRRRARGGTLSLLEAQRIASRFQTRCSLAQGAVLWSVGTWADALGITIMDREAFDAPAILALDATVDDPPYGADGPTVTVTWTVWGRYDRITLTPPGVEVDRKGMKTVAVDTMTAFELHVHDAETIIRESAQAGPKPPRILSLKSEHDSYAPGDDAGVGWVVEHAHRLVLEPGAQDVTGEQSGTIRISGSPTPATIRAIGSGGEEIVETCRLPTIQIETFKNLPNDDSDGYALTWSVRNAERVELDGDVVPPSSDCYLLPSSPRSVTHVLEAHAASGSVVRQSLSLEPCVIQSFRADRTTALEGETIMLTFDVDHAKVIWLDDGWHRRAVTDRNSVEYPVRRGKTTLHLQAAGVLDTDEAILDVRGVRKRDVIEAVPVPDVTTHVTVADVDVALPSLNVIETRNALQMEGQVESAQSDVLSSLVSDQHDAEIRQVVADADSVSSDAASKNVFRRIAEWIRRETRLFSIVPRATGTQIRSLVRRVIPDE